MHYLYNNAIKNTTSFDDVVHIFSLLLLNTFRSIKSSLSKLFDLKYSDSSECYWMNSYEC